MVKINIKPVIENINISESADGKSYGFQVYPTFSIIRVFSYSREFILNLFGNMTVIEVPFPGSLSSVIFALWYNAPCFTIDSPSPVPPISLE